MTNRILAGLIMILALSMSTANANDFGTKVLRVNGSDNVARFVGVYAKEYMAEHPETNVVVIGGKTSTGFKASSSRLGIVCGTCQVDPVSSIL